MESLQPVDTAASTRKPVAHVAPEPTQRADSSRERRPFFGRVIGRLRYEGARLYARLDPVVSACCAGSRWAGALYYFLWAGRFRREQSAFLAGRKRYLADCQSPVGNAWLLRRNVHRLEKALCMRPLRDEFAAGYIVETVAAYAAMLNAASPEEAQDAVDRELLSWTHDVLELYFTKTAESANGEISAGCRQFQAQPQLERDDDAGRRVPYARDLDAPSPVSIDDLRALALRRRSVRWFERKPVPREKIDAAVEVAAFSPAACNRQAFELRVFDAPEDVQKVAAVPMGTAGYSENIPAIAVLVGRMDAFFDERDRHLIYIDASLFAMGFVYALETQGIASCCINWPDIEEKERELEDLLNLEAWERPVMMIALGYPDPKGLVPFSQKKPVDEIRHYCDLRPKP